MKLTLSMLPPRIGIAAYLSRGATKRSWLHDRVVKGGYAPRSLLLHHHANAQLAMGRERSSIRCGDAAHLVRHMSQSHIGSDEPDIDVQGLESGGTTSAVED